MCRSFSVRRNFAVKASYTRRKSSTRRLASQLTASAIVVASWSPLASSSGSTSRRKNSRSPAGAIRDFEPGDRRSAASLLLTKKLATHARRSSSESPPKEARYTPATRNALRTTPRNVDDHSSSVIDASSDEASANVATSASVTFEDTVPHTVTSATPPNAPQRASGPKPRIVAAASPWSRTISRRVVASAGEDAFARLAPAAYVFPARTADAFRGVPSEGASNEGDGAEAGAEASAEANASAGAGADANASAGAGAEANASAGPSAKVRPATRSATRSAPSRESSAACFSIQPFRVELPKPYPPGSST